jgi:8-oxo-dGTP pyrophosphatase MutT (NUDIX family)
MLKRASDVKFPNFYAFPGGMLDKEDHPQVWKANMPFYYDYYLEGGAKTFPDFAKRMAAMRELYEECNLLAQA